jgi:hypothetical protein
MEQINTCDVLFRGGGKKNFMFFFPARKAQDVRWEVVCTFRMDTIKVLARGHRRNNPPPATQKALPAHIY